MSIRRDLERRAFQLIGKSQEDRRGPPEFRPAEEKTTTPPMEVVQVYPAKQEASLLVGR